MSQEDYPPDISEDLQKLVSDDDIKKYIFEQCTTHNVVSVGSEYNTAKKYRNILGEDKYIYRMTECEWGYEFNIILKTIENEEKYNLNL